MAASTTHGIAFPAFTPAFDNSVFDTWVKVGTVYKEAMDASAQNLFLSSARIVQEQTLRAMVSAAHSCAEALAQNAVQVQQQSVARFSAANQKAAEIMGRAWIEGMTPKMTTAR